jgi:hypothetical protein
VRNDYAVEYAKKHSNKFRIMKILPYILAASATIAAIGCGVRHESGSKSDLQDSKDKAYVSRLIAGMNADEAALYFLAVERFHVHESRGEIWVLRVHEGLPFEEDSLQKYSNGKFVVASLPTEDNVESAGIRLYAAQYNALTVEKADTLALDGSLQQALKIYNLVRRFDNCMVGVDNAVGPRIDLIKQILNGGDKQALREKLAKMRQNFAPSVFEFVETKSAISVTNLMSLNLGE